MSVDAAAALAACAGSLAGAGPLPAVLRFSTDTRSIEPGEIFVALRGARFDGHDYVAAARAAGAAGFVVDDARTLPPGLPGIVVADTTRAYLAFAGLARARSRARVVAVTGSAGKTTTKAFLAHVLECAAPGRVAATPRNENNEIGVAKLFLGLPEDAAYVVVEFGARHVGEIAELARAGRPETAILTNVGDAHLEIFGSFERLAETKWGIFATGARPVLGAADATSRAFAERDGLDAAAWWFGVAGDPDAPAGARAVTVTRTALAVTAADRVRTVRPAAIAVPGEHNLRNVAAAAAAALDLGVPPATIAAALGTLALPAGRYERVAVPGFPGVGFIYDAYNANRSGMLATLASFGAEPASRRIAVLGSMAELGDDAAAMHAEVGRAAAAAGLAVLLVGGDFAADLAAGARAAGMPADGIVPFDDAPAAAGWLRAHARPGDLILLKGSRRYRLEDVLAGLGSVHAG